MGHFRHIPIVAILTAYAAFSSGCIGGPDAIEQFRQVANTIQTGKLSVCTEVRNCEKYPTTQGTLDVLLVGAGVPRPVVKSEPTQDGYMTREMPYQVDLQVGNGGVECRELELSFYSGSTRVAFNPDDLSEKGIKYTPKDLAGNPFKDEHGQPLVLDAKIDENEIRGGFVNLTVDCNNRHPNLTGSASGDVKMRMLLKSSFGARMPAKVATELHRKDFAPQAGSADSRTALLESASANNVPL